MNLLTFKPYLVVAVILCLLTSCARLINSPYKTVTVYTTRPSKLFFNNDSLLTSENQAEIVLRRGKAPVKVKIVSDSITKNITLKAHNSGAYYLNIPANFGVGMLVDMRSSKRYSYPSYIYVNSADTLSRYYHHNRENKKGKNLLHVSLPYINSFRLSPDNERVKINTGFLGIAVGFDHYHTNNQYINASISAVMDNEVFVPIGVDYRSTHTKMHSIYGSVSNNHKIGALSLGYGIAYAKNNWTIFQYNDSGTQTDSVTHRSAYIGKTSKNRYSVGLVSSAYYEIVPAFNIGVIYRPTFISFSGANRYEHLISIDLVWKIAL
ncbi:hypothetical protein IM792_07600 [Mucilaginibacter sp. JRF]|uniref:hypothetical protein n=1 Tax=Mucilaginibacter sp. JRF TaxID=2780088 RepID=UPI001881AEAD|nr:hypothetical protein [Mucilaginibacter sp. JRF]MBE9584307.1 hypothetical protein [Mucilaginibacter sp. JRF]